MTSTNDSALIQCRNLTFGYGERTILKNLSFDVPVSYTHLTLPTKA